MSKANPRTVAVVMLGVGLGIAFLIGISQPDTNSSVSTADTPANNAGAPQEQTSVADALAALAVLQIKTDVAGTPDAPVISLVIDGDGVLENIKNLQAIGILNSEMKETYFRVNQETTYLVIGLSGAEAGIIAAFTGPTKPISSLTLKCAVDVPDNLGHDSYIEYFSLSLTRADFDRVNWDRVEPLKLRLAVPQFEWAPGAPTP